MGNYKDLEYEFIERTLLLIGQYEDIFPRFEFQEQYNYTLLINCLLGLIVLPKERIITYIPNDRLTPGIKMNMGLVTSVIGTGINTLRDLIINLRNSIAHFDIRVISNDDNFLINEIAFTDQGRDIVRFKANELLPFIKYYSGLLLKNLRLYRKNNTP